METERLLLRAYRWRDLADFRCFMQDPQALAFEPFDVLNDRETRRELRGRMNNPDYTAVVLRAENRLIGNLYLCPGACNTLELGFLFNRSDWHKGYASEACRAVIQDAFRQGVHRIWARCDPDNGPSRRLLERLGFSLEGRLRQDHAFRADKTGAPIWRDTCIYGMINEMTGDI